MNKFKNLFFIMLGFAIGQGAMFVAQTNYAINDRFDDLGVMMICLGVLSLAQWFSDCGGVYILSARLKGGFSVLEFLVFRIVLSVIVSVVSAISVFTLNFDRLPFGVLVFIPVVVVASAFNLTGVLDYQRRNVVAGPLSGLPWLFSAIGMLYLDVDDELSSGLVVGGGFSLGLILSTVIHYCLVDYSFGVLKGGVKKGWRKTGGEVFFYNLSFFTSQVYGRLVPVLVGSYFGASVAGVYMYAKSISNITSQFVAFSRRVEFSGLIGKKPDFYSLLKSQYLSFGFVAIGLLGVVSVVLIMSSMDFANQRLEDSMEMLIVFQLMQVPWVVGSIYGQYCVANGLLVVHSKILALSVIACLLIMVVLMEMGVSLWFVILAEFFMYFLQVALYMYVVRWRGGES